MGNRVEGYTGSVVNVIIPTYYHGESMYSVGAHAFEDCATLKSFTLEEGEISCFESGSFVNCTNLEYIVLEGNVRYIYGSAFAEEFHHILYLADTHATFLHFREDLELCLGI